MMVFLLGCMLWEYLRVFGMGFTGKHTVSLKLAQSEAVGFISLASVVDASATMQRLDQSRHRSIRRPQLGSHNLDNWLGHRIPTCRPPLRHLRPQMDGHGDEHSGTGRMHHRGHSKGH